MNPARARRPASRQVLVEVRQIGGHRLPSFTFAADDYVHAYDGPTLARLRSAIRAYDPHGVMAIGHVLGA
ncbi:hypothetical protein [Kribbella sancticallisti]|uniref:hypothetical protein n=1 Tax=Kribbella sancticallisti TaxID=460087 RepID=UPI0031D0CFBB